MSYDELRKYGSMMNSYIHSVEASLLQNISVVGSRVMNLLEGRRSHPHALEKRQADLN